MQGHCPICDATLTLGNDVIIGELLECAECGTELEVLSVQPLQLAEAPQEEEDWGE